MKNTSSDSSAIKFSIKVYQTLLLAYPARFRGEYGSHLVQVFGDCCLRAFRQSGMNGMMRLWTTTLLDLGRSMFAEHLAHIYQEAGMTNTKFVRLSGWALMAGVAALLPWMITLMLGGTLYSNSWAVLDNLGLFGLLYGPILLVLGMLGLRARYGRLFGALGQGILMAGALGGCGLVVLILYNLKYTLEDINVGIGIMMTCLVVLFLSLLLFGMLTLTHKPLSRGNGLPLAAGLALPMFMKIYGVLTGIRFWVENPFFLLLSIIGFVVMAAALIRFGYIVQADEAHLTPTYS